MSSNTYFGEDTKNSYYRPLTGRNLGIKNGDIFTGKFKDNEGAPTIQVSIYASHNCIIRIQQTIYVGYAGNVMLPVLSDDVYEYTTINKPMFIQRTLGFTTYRIVCENQNEENMKTLYLTTRLVNHPAITQGVIL